MWNDTDIPLAHLITFRCTIPGYMETRVALQIVSQSVQLTHTYIPANDNCSSTRQTSVKPVTLNAAQRHSVEVL